MPAVSASKFLVQAGWDDIPHLDAKTKADLLQATLPHMREARSKGVPSMGAGAIWPVEESLITVAPFVIPDYWPRCYSLDVGWNKTAVIWGAYDRSIDCLYLYTEHYRGKAVPSIHATAIRARGEWIPGVIDPAARGRGQADGRQLLHDYRDLGLELHEADNTVESGIYAVWERLSAGRIKVFRTLPNWLSEYRLYRRDDKGRIVKTNDHLMDGTRYVIQSGLSRAIVKPVPSTAETHFPTEF